MSIKKISLTNYKCFDKVSLSLNNFNVIIGPNASGKSSLIQIFKFLKDFDDYGLDNAISLQGGVEYFRNINIGHNKNFSLSISVEGRDSLAGMGKDKPVLIERKNLDYNLELKFLKNSKRYTVINENLTQFVEFFRFNEKERKLTKEHSLGKGEIVINRKNNKIYRNYNLPSLEKNINIEELTPPFLKGLSIPNNDSMLSFPFVSYPFPPRIFENIKIYDFEPRLSKKAIPFTGENELQEDGENLAIILNTLFKNRENKRKFLNLVKDILPFFEDSKTEKLTDKSFIFSLREKYLKSSKKYLLSSFLSDGTINILGLIIALFFQRDTIISIIEEPERNLHPSLISKVVSLMQEASKRKQIVITTHNPEILKHCSINEILFVKRDLNGIASITKPSEKQQVINFLKNDVGIDELFIQNLIQ